MNNESPAALLPDGWRLEPSDDGRTIWVCGRGHRIGVEFGDPLWMLFRAFSTAPAASEGRTALNNVRAAMGSPEYKEGL